MFIKISKKVEYALIVLNHFYKSEVASASAREISEKYKLPFDTTAKVMQMLSTHQLLSSTQGVKGGYQLCKNLASVNYLTIYEIIEGKKAASDCKDMGCKLIETCNITGPINNLNNSLITFIQGLSLEDLFNNNTPERILKEAIYG